MRKACSSQPRPELGYISEASSKYFEQPILAHPAVILCSTWSRATKLCVRSFARVRVVAAVACRSAAKAVGRLACSYIVSCAPAWQQCSAPKYQQPLLAEHAMTVMRAHAWRLFCSPSVVAGRFQQSPHQGLCRSGRYMVGVGIGRNTVCRAGKAPGAGIRLACERACGAHIHDAPERGIVAWITLATSQRIRVWLFPGFEFFTV